MGAFLALIIILALIVLPSHFVAAAINKNWRGSGQRGPLGIYWLFFAICALVIGILIYRFLSTAFER
jgi:hypothetical protein